MILKKHKVPYDVVMDCIASGDPRDQANMDYGQLLWQQQGDSQGSSSSSSPFLKPHGQYRRLGGISPDWFRAGVERTYGPFLCGQMIVPNSFGFKCTNAAPALRQLTSWLEHGYPSGGGRTRGSETVPFTTPAGVQQGLDALLGRRIIRIALARLGK